MTIPVSARVEALGGSVSYREACQMPWLTKHLVATMRVAS